MRFKKPAKRAAASGLTVQIMFFPRRSTVISPARRSSLRWNEIVDVIRSAPVTWQQIAPTVGPSRGLTSPSIFDSNRAAAVPQKFKDMQACRITQRFEHRGVIGLECFFCHLSCDLSLKIYF